MCLQAYIGTQLVLVQNICAILCAILSFLPKSSPTNIKQSSILCQVLIYVRFWGGGGRWWKWRGWGKGEVVEVEGEVVEVEGVGEGGEVVEVEGVGEGGRWWKWRRWGGGGGAWLKWDHSSQCITGAVIVFAGVKLKFCLVTFFFFFLSKNSILIL